MKTDYTEIDLKIVEQIRNNKRRFFQIENVEIHDIAQTIAQQTNRAAFRVIDGRLQTLRKRGLIKFTKGYGWETAE